eukprot:TRINITY_DN10605_c0_g1_i4.p1 TRINITY_DN10605_c0_g1~~TRINITY_DN10605_c0_g1_i4.p1  ORF type:complete len:285 (+),score=60.93 TRINITY_DN10605_c0_g1_i4:70-924(+)
MAVYPQSDVQRFVVEPNKALWTEDYPEYKPAEFTHPSVLAQPVWADKPEQLSSFKWNEIDGSIDRTTANPSPYTINERGLPLNYRGRTGIAGRGLLGKFGPNHAADPIVTRWKRDVQGKVVLNAKKEPILQVVLIRRKDNNELALPGGMVDAGDSVGQTLRKEFGEEALASIEGGEAKAAKLKAVIDRIFDQGGEEIYSGYMDDPRNTDNAWMETTAVNFHDETGAAFGDIPLEAGDDAGEVAWMDITPDIKLYANHSMLVLETLRRRRQHYAMTLITARTCCT